jgi:UDP-N-acetylglucosamine transferase subunit ALG13
MIFVTLGTNDKPFTRLIRAVEKAAEAGVIRDRVVVQSGFTQYESKVIEVFPYIDRDQFADYMNQAD